MPAQVKSGGKLEPTRRPHRQTRPAWSRLDCFKPNPQRLINRPTATLARRRRAQGADQRRLVAGKTARCSIRGCEPVSRDEWASAPRDAVLNPWHSQEKLGETLLDHLVYLKAKTGGDKSMPEKRESSEDAYGVVPQDPRDRAKA
jgi:hypothetical protein